jgi:hypothetical protein
MTDLMFRFRRGSEKKEGYLIKPKENAAVESIHAYFDNQCLDANAILRLADGTGRVPKAVALRILGYVRYKGPQQISQRTVHRWGKLFKIPTHRHSVDPIDLVALLVVAAGYRLDRPEEEIRTAIHIRKYRFQQQTREIIQNDISTIDGITVIVRAECA